MCTVFCHDIHHAGIAVMMQDKICHMLRLVKPRLLIIGVSIFVYFIRMMHHTNVYWKHGN